MSCKTVLRDWELVQGTPGLGALLRAAPSLPPVPTAQGLGSSQLLGPSAALASPDPSLPLGFFPQLLPPASSALEPSSGSVAVSASVPPEDDLGPSEHPIRPLLMRASGEHAATQECSLPHSWWVAFLLYNPVLL